MAIQLGETAFALTATVEDAAGFDELGYLLRERIFAPEEVSLLARAGRTAALSPGRPTDDGAGTDKIAPAGTIFAVHCRADAFRRLRAHPRLLGPVRVLLGHAAARLHGSRLWPGGELALDDNGWRREIEVWPPRDLPHRRLITAAVFLADGSARGGGLAVVPRSHAEHVGTGRLRPFLPLLAPAGSVLFLDGSLSYAHLQLGAMPSTPLCFLTYNAARNHAAGAHEPQHASLEGDGELLEESDDCLWPLPIWTAG